MTKKSERSDMEISKEISQNLLELYSDNPVLRTMVMLIPGFGSAIEYNIIHRYQKMMKNRFKSLL
jgi:hypothetical protein